MFSKYDHISVYLKRNVIFEVLVQYIFNLYLSYKSVIFQIRIMQCIVETEQILLRGLVLVEQIYKETVFVLSVFFLHYRIPPFVLIFIFYIIPCGFSFFHDNRKFMHLFIMSFCQLLYTALPPAPAMPNLSHSVSVFSLHSVL